MLVPELSGPSDPHRHLSHSQRQTATRKGDCVGGFLADRKDRRGAGVKSRAVTQDARPSPILDPSLLVLPQAGIPDIGVPKFIAFLRFSIIFPMNFAAPNSVVASPFGRPMRLRKRKTSERRSSTVTRSHRAVPGNAGGSIV